MEINMTTKDLVLEKANRLIELAKESVGEIKKVTISEAWKILQLTTAGMVQILEAIATDLSGPEKKAIALEFINNFYDKVFLVVSIPLVPNFVEPIIHSYVKRILMMLVDASIDSIVKIFRDTGVFLNKRSNNG
jgi:hypothetical protein